MKAESTKEIAQRREVARRLRDLFARWTAFLSTGSAAIWERAERGAADKPAPRAEPPMPPAGVMSMPMQQQPVQAQQQKLDPGEEKK